ncbi:NAD(P)/FAD-dependent oxidoreductase [Pelagibacterium montanilacus]|uniref:NAD(P)/FAD-dependent oxidoreductase n=1 Tax=Pelagibacterium montanilacus TaxID=2185280 RepID=UPI000F8C97EC|nr:FAD-binding oxidoreductase [Pelagibacterium montanilacus]
MKHDVIILGAGIVGISTGIHLLRRGRSVLIVDRREPGRETSYGNAGVIQREGVRPHTFPRDLSTLMQVGLHLSTAARYDPLALPRFAPPLLRYWWKSSPGNYRQIVRSYAPLIGMSIDEHADFIAAASADDLVVRKGWMFVYRTAEALRRDAAKARADHEQFGINSSQIEGAELERREPDLKKGLAGAIHWQDPWTIRNPGALVSAYFELFKSLGGTFLNDRIDSLETDGEGWSVRTANSLAEGREAVVALGPWAPEVLEPLGYRLPLFVKRGYHMHYGTRGEAKLNTWILDTEVGYLLAPMTQGIRLTTGAEFAHRDSAPTPIQLGKAEAEARKLFPLGDRLDPEPWKGARPCTPDMMPIIGPAPRHKGLWAAIGHAHHGFTLGPATGRLLSEAMTGTRPAIDISPFAMERFRGSYGR